MAVAVGMGVAVGVSVGERVKVGLGTGVALAVGEESGAAAPAQPARQRSMKSKHNDRRMVSFLFFRGKRINTVRYVFIYNR